MATGNAFFGTLTGSIGDTTFAVVNGQQVVKAKATQTRDAKTKSQVLQRARFSTAVAFFTRGTQNLFKFAYQTKGQLLSDYNAFMKYNTSKGIYFTPEMNENPAYPALGQFWLSKGSLKAPKTLPDDDNIWYSIGYVGEEYAGSISDIRQFSTLANTVSGWQYGDLITMLAIESRVKGGTPQAPFVLNGETESPTWDIQQIQLDDSSVDMFSYHGWKCKVDEHGMLLVGHTKEDTYISGYALVHSRNTTKGLRVSSARIFFGTESEHAWNLAQTSVYKNVVVASWDPNDSSILEGAITEQEIYTVTSGKDRWSGYIPAKYESENENTLFGTWIPRGGFNQTGISFRLETSVYKTDLVYLSDKSDDPNLAIFATTSTSQALTKFRVLVNKSNGECYLNATSAWDPSDNPRITEVILGKLPII